MILSEPPSMIRSRRLGAPLPRRELGRFLKDAQQQIGLAGQVTVLLATDERLRELNRDFRHKDAATDVLSFPAEAGPEGDHSGDLAISLETAARQAERFGHSTLNEVKILILHGLLHLAGFDHETDRGRMARRERALREHFELPVGLIQRSRQKATA